MDRLQNSVPVQDHPCRQTLKMTDSKPTPKHSRKLPVKKHRCPFPIRCVNCEHRENITDDSNPNSPSHLEPIALDCEMVGVGLKKESALGRVTIVGYSGQTLYDVIVRPDEEITDYRTQWSGIDESDMRRAIPFSCAQDQVQRIVRNRIVVGHMVHYDFQVLRIQHPPQLIRDTGKSPYAKLLAGFPTKPSIGLRSLTLRLFGVHIQEGEHCSAEDARATMAIYRLVQTSWENDLLKTVRKRKSPNVPIFQLFDSSPSGKASPDENSLGHLDSELSTDSPLHPLCMTKRRCENSLVLEPTLRLNKSSSSVSLLDDDYWQDCSD